MKAIKKIMSTTDSNQSAIAVAKAVITTEIEGLSYVQEQLNENFEQAVATIIAGTGRVIVCGMGKSGIIGKKIAASLASTGTPSFFMHPGEAFHGDLGMVKSEDVFIAISNSGETDEVLKLLPFLRDNHNFIIAMTGRENSTLAKHADCHLSIAVPKEACPLQLAPTASTTATLAMGDALTVALMQKRGFRPENFARFHPGGSLGKRLLGRVEDEMQAVAPFVSPDESIVDVLQAISKFALGMVLVSSNPMAIITDGDLRRAIEKHGKHIFDLTATDIATPSPQQVSPQTSLQRAYEIMDKCKISALVVVKCDDVVGILKK